MASDTRVWDAIRRTVSEIGRASVRAGVVGAKASEPHGSTGEDNGEIALWMEYGTRMLPPRSFIRKTLEDPGVRAELAALETVLVAQVIAGTLSRDEALSQIGAFMAGKMRATIEDDQVTPELQQSTIDRKGHDKVLVETGVLAAAIGWDIVK